MISAKHYFDWAATAPNDEEILTKALKYSMEHWGNPSSIHKAGTDAKDALENARKRAAQALGVNAENIFFTSGGTEGDHLALLSVLSRPQKGSVVLSSIEHPALREMSKSMQNCGWKVINVNPDKNGIVCAQSIADALQEDTAFVSVMAVNNETGAIQPIYEIAKIIEEKTKGKRKPFFHVDCVQAAGKIPLNLKASGIDSASFSAHKIGGPRGIGILYLAKELNSFLKGGGQEKTVRSGTENLFGAEAFSLCLEKYFISERNSSAEKRFEQQKILTANFIKKLKEIKGCVIIPHCREDEKFAANFSPWVVQAAFPGIPGQVMERALSEKGFFISTGSACSSSHKGRPVLDTMQLSPKEKESAVRFSFGFSTEEESMNELIEELKNICSQFL
ncbi:cysteine desulfurase family protein [uncultured Treponema sp.]|uniref:cysteine desulfurase family protein n=1 Tax=uncultured Treponema sp. TaxID=162155 RepID=UPI0025CE14B4|nr:cysteine desulfurase family protein [uncultured Treponema sp.]